MAKKMSVEEILAAARAEKAQAGATSSPSPTPPEEPTPAAPAAPVVAAAAETLPPAAAPAPPGSKMPAGGKGMSMADILAAARAKKGEGAPVAEKPKAAVAEKPAKPAVTEKPAAKPAAAKPAAKAAEVPATAAKDTASILAAARKGAKPGPISKEQAAALGKPTTGGKTKLEVPPMPAKPDYARPAPAAAADDASRRSFMAIMAGALFGSSLAIGFTSLAVTHLMWILGLARYMFPNILIEPPTKFKVGFPDQLAPGQVETKFIPQFGVWIVRY
ncbi:MAG: hypothetical protein SFU86_05960, partial [Pirellulaceae bacterium]|nr:hypothetical protein [Pirellulaceae bacterium]